MDTQALLRQLADEIRGRADFERQLAAEDEKRVAEYRDLALVLDAVAMKVADGDISTASIHEVLAAARPARFSAMRPTKESEAARLRRIFALPAAP